jgi:undecaprenyldiphospho-muramoylpentapeptide beta-N-acetylglucosaminyltransferase
VADTRRTTFAIIAGGGTAGHVLPGLAIAAALVARGHDQSSIHYVGSQGRIEERLVPEAGYEVTLLPGRGIERRVTVRNIGAALGIVRAFGRAILLVRRHRPRVVVAVGGYASVAVALAAKLWRIPIVVAEQNAIPGAANRLVARFARAAAVSFPDTPLPRAVVTGNPVRPAVLEIDRQRDGAAAKAALGVDPGRRLVLVTGGSLGALRINKATIDALDHWKERADLAVRHIVGNRDWDVIRADEHVGATGRLQYLPVHYDDDMARTMAAADVAVSRAGSSTCFELAAVGLPAVLVPSPYVTADHQTANARHLVSTGGAVLVRDDEFDGERLVAEVDGLLADPAKLEAMAAAMLRFARPKAADEIAALAEAHATPR